MEFTDIDSDCFKKLCYRNGVVVGGDGGGGGGGYDAASPSHITEG